MTIYYTADPHLGHDKIRLYCNRPHKDLLSMDNNIINNINERVKEDDTLIIDGDFCFSKSSEAKDAPKKPFNYYRDQIKCKNVIIIEGNHDRRNSIKTCVQKLIIKQGGKDICIVHNPEHADFRYEINLVGHVHEKWLVKRYKQGEHFTDCINLGVDVWGFKPITINEILSIYSRWLKEQNDKTN